jgi:hypothetical protein
MQPIEHSDTDDRTSIEQFTDAELTAIMRPAVARANG